MDKLLFSEGGQPLHLDDLEFLQGSFQGSLLSFISALGNYIIGGCAITYEHDAVHWTPGYISYQGKVYRVDSGSLPHVEDDPLYWVFSHKTTARKVFADSSEHPTQESYTASLSLNEEGASVSAYGFPRLGKDIARVTDRKVTASGSVGIVGFSQVSRLSGILTLRLVPSAYPLSSSFASIAISGGKNLQAEPITLSPSGCRISLSTNGALSMRRADVGFSHQRIDEETIFSMIVSWSSAAGEASSDASSVDAGIRGRR